MKTVGENRRRSAAITQGANRASDRAMLHAAGFTRQDLEKPIIAIAAVCDGDIITFDVSKRQLSVALNDDEIERRLGNWRQPEARYLRGVFAKYAATVSSAAQGAVTQVAVQQNQPALSSGQKR